MVMLSVAPCAPPTDPWAAWIVSFTWPQEAAIQTLIDCVSAWAANAEANHQRADELRAARDQIVRSVEAGADFEAMYADLSRIMSNRSILGERFSAMARYMHAIVEECYEAQHEQFATGQWYGYLADTAARAGNMLAARIAIQDGINRCWAKLLPRLKAVADYDARIAAMPLTVRASGPTGAPAAPPAPHPSDVQAVDYRPTSGDEAPGSHGGTGAAKSNSGSSVGTSVARTTSDSQAGAHGGGDSAVQQQGDPKVGSHQPHDDDGERSDRAGNGASDPKGDSKTGSHQPAGPPPAVGPAPGSTSTSSTSTTPVSSLTAAAGSAPSAGGSGSSGLSGLLPSTAASSGVSPATASGVGRGVGGPPAGAVGGPVTAAGAGGAGGGVGAVSGGSASAGGGGGSGGPRVSPPPVEPPVVSPVVSPVTPAPPGAVAASSAGSLGANAPAVQPITPSSTAAVSPGASAAAAAGGPVMPVSPAVMPPAMGGATGAGSAPAAPQVAGAAPTPSPGLTQGAVGGGGAATAAAERAAMSAPAAVGVVPAEYVASHPARVDRYAQLAVDTVTALMPAMAVMPGLAVAAAVVQARGDVPQVLIATNDGESYLPAGCFVPRSVQVVQMDVEERFGSAAALEFGQKWFGWADPCRPLLDYVVLCEQRGCPVELLGLATAGLVSAEVRAAFGAVVSSVGAVLGARPLEPLGNRHRLQVVAPDLYAAVMRAGEVAQIRAAWRAIRAAVALPGSAAVQAHPVWHTLTVGGMMPDPEMWSALREDYEAGVRMLGVRRPGLMRDGGPGDLFGSAFMTPYCSEWVWRRTQEALLTWESFPVVSAPDALYAAYQTGVPISAELLVASD